MLEAIDTKTLVATTVSKTRNPVGPEVEVQEQSFHVQSAPIDLGITIMREFSARFVNIVVF